MEKKPQVLVIADDDLYYGISKGYYPEMLKASDNGSLGIIPIEDFKQKEDSINFKTRPLFDGKDFYVLDPYSECYISMNDSNILNELFDSHSLVVKEAFVRMGAKSISLHEETEDTDNSHTKAGVNGNFKLASAKIDIDYTKNVSLNIKSKIESHDPNRKPQSYESVRNYVFSHGLGNDTAIMTLLGRLEHDGRLYGTESYSISYYSELQSALQIASSINYKLFSADLDFSTEHNHIHTIKKTIELDFGQ